MGGWAIAVFAADQGILHGVPFVQGKLVGRDRLPPVRVAVYILALL